MSKAWKLMPIVAAILLAGMGGSATSAATLAVPDAPLADVEVGLGDLAATAVADVYARSRQFGEISEEQLEQQLANLRLVDQLQESIGALGAGPTSILAAFAAIQARQTVGLPDTDVVGHTTTVGVVAAASAMAARHGVTLSQEDASTLAGYESSLSELSQQALDDVFVRFMEMEDASARAFGINRDEPNRDAAEAAFFAQRNAFIDSVMEFVAGGLTASASASDPDPSVNACPAFAIDWNPRFTRFTEDCALILNLAQPVEADPTDEMFWWQPTQWASYASVDTYSNNAGGNGDGTCSSPTMPAAAIVDLWGSDSYGFSGDRSCGQVGGGFFGSGMIIDFVGDDMYRANSFGVTGGAAAGAGLIIDGEGDDAYLAGWASQNCVPFPAVLMPLSIYKHDACGKGSYGVNGGGFAEGYGAVLDLLGSDGYSAGGAVWDCELCGVGSYGVNGGGYGGGYGLLVDADGAYSVDIDPVTGELWLWPGVDVPGNWFNAGWQSSCSQRCAIGFGGVNGGGLAGYGTLIELGMRSSEYQVAVDGDCISCSVGADSNGGASVGGVGFLWDAGGSDRYSVGNSFSISDCDDVCSLASYGVNGGGYLGGWGMLMDGAGAANSFLVGHQSSVTCTDCKASATDFSHPISLASYGVNGGGSFGGAGTLLSPIGENKFWVGMYSTSTCDSCDYFDNVRSVGAVPLPFYHPKGSHGSNGGGYVGVGLLHGGITRDSYRAGECGANGGGPQVNTVWHRPCWPFDVTLGSGLLFDPAGTDQYNDQQSGIGTDQDVVPKGNYGFQIDNAQPGIVLFPADSDGDGVMSDDDNCPFVANAGQADSDGDGIGDACDGWHNYPSHDVDGDGVPNGQDNCPNRSNGNQQDDDGDGIGNACDGGQNDGPDGDLDGDGVPNSYDNCGQKPNASQRDSDGDGQGDACDTVNNHAGKTVADPNAVDTRGT